MQNVNSTRSRKKQLVGGWTVNYLQFHSFPFHSFPKENGVGTGGNLIISTPFPVFHLFQERMGTSGNEWERVNILRSKTPCKC